VFCTAAVRRCVDPRRAVQRAASLLSSGRKRERRALPCGRRRSERTRHQRGQPNGCPMSGGVSTWLNSKCEAKSRLFPMCDKLAGCLTCNRSARTAGWSEQYFLCQHFHQKWWVTPHTAWVFCCEWSPTCCNMAPPAEYVARCHIKPVTLCRLTGSSPHASASLPIASSGSRFELTRKSHASRSVRA